MNFLAHYYLDRQSDDSLFVIGLVTPDLVSLYDRSISFRERNIRKRLEGVELRKGEAALLQGVYRHFEADGIFHDSDFFKTESSFIAKKLRDTFGEAVVGRSFFVGHVLLELCLDRVIMEAIPNLLDRFYTHFQQVPVLEIARCTALIAGQPLEQYEPYISSFIEKAFLRKYVDPQHIVRVLRRILQMVNIEESDRLYLKDPRFLDVLEDVENRLRVLYGPALEKMRQGLSHPFPPVWRKAI